MLPGPPCRFRLGAKRLKKYSIKTHIEFGPGKVLSSLAKQNRVEGEFNSVDNLELFLKLLEEYGS